MAYAGPIIELADLVPEMRMTPIRRSGEPLQAYVNTRTCPGSIKAQVSAARRRYLAQGDDGQFNVLLQELMMAIVPGLGLGEADGLSGDEDLCLSLLADLGWAPKQGEDETDPPVTGEASPPTTETSSPDSTPRTDAETG